MVAINFPYSLKARSITLEIAASVITGGNNQQVVNATGGGYWTLAFEGFVIRTPAQIRLWRALQFGAQGGVRPINIRLCELRRAPAGVTYVPHSDLSPFSDTSLYESSLSDGALVANAALRDTSMIVAFNDDVTPLPGMLFSMFQGGGFHELHVVTDVEETGGNYRLTFEPPMRADHIAGESVSFDHPTLTARLADPRAMTMKIDLDRFAQPNASFVEYLT